MTTEPVFRQQIMLNNVRLLRVSLTKPYVGKDAKIDPATGKAKGKYHVDATFPPTHPQFVEVETAIRTVAAARWKELAEQTLGMIKGNKQRFPFQRGDLMRPGKPAYAGMVYLSAGNEDQPTILVTEGDTNLSTRPALGAQLGGAPVLTPAHPCWPYEGSYGNVLVEIYSYMFNNTDPGIGCGLLGVQFYKHGERLKGSTVASGKEFGLVPRDADSAPKTAPATGSQGLI